MRGLGGKGNRDAVELDSGLPKARIEQSLVPQKFHIQVGRGDRRFEPEAPGLGQQAAVFGDKSVPAEYQVGGGFPASGAGVNIPGDETRGLAFDQASAVVRLPREFWTGRGIEDDLRTA